MDATIRKWGNSLALRVPRAMAEDARIHLGSLVDLAVVKGKLVISPKGRRRNLSDLIGGISKDNLHSESDWGGPAGREAW